MLGTDLKIVGFGVALLLLSLSVSCADGGQIKAGEQLTIGGILSNSTEYEGETVTLSGEYRGWEPGYGSPPVTRSDWILKDETGAMYVTGKVPPGLDPVDDRGKEVTVYGVVRVKDDRAYIEAQIVR